MNIRSLYRFLTVLLASISVASAGGMPLDVRKDDQAKLSGKPAVTRDGERTKISFTVIAATDVEVAVLDAKGQAVRHLAAGLIGPNAPEPLAKDSLAQELFWDGKDDVGRPAAGGPFKVRIRVGSQAKLDKYLGRQPLMFVGNINAITVGDGGELFVLSGEDFKFGRSELIVLDKDGKYLRTIMPYSAGTPADRTQSVGHLMIEGQRVPILFSGHAFCVYPLVCGIRGQTMAWHPKGYLLAISSTGTAREHGVPRYLLAFDPQGGAPAGLPFVGPLVLEPRGFLGGAGERTAVGMDRIAVSPDGKYIYLVHHFDSNKLNKLRKHGVYRLTWATTQAEQLWLGHDNAGAGEEDFNDPQGIAVARDGTLFICDRGNNRVKVYSSEGKPLGNFAVETPEQIAIHPGTGNIFVLTRAAGKKVADGRLLAFGPWKDGTMAKLAETAGATFMALDPKSEPMRLWLASQTGTITPLTFANGKFEAGKPIQKQDGLVNPSFLAADPQRDRVIVKEHLVLRHRRPFRALSPTTGKMEVLDLAGSDITLDADGNIYCTDGYQPTFIRRYDPSGKPLPFAGSESNEIPVLFRSYGPDMGLHGHRVALNGDIYIVRSVNHGIGASLDVYGPDGKLKKAGLVAGIGGGDAGLGLDAASNIYLGLNIRPANNPFPPEFAGKVPTANWMWWRKSAVSTPWSYIYINPYLFHMGAVFKFKPEGGTIYGQQRAKGANDQITSAGTELERAPADAVAYKSAYLQYDVKVAGAQWRYGGVGVIPASIDGPSPDPGCKCMPSHLDSDRYGRVFAPNPFLFAVEMLDSAGNRIARIGRYGNGDDAEPAIAFAGPEACDFSDVDGRLYVSDIANRRVAVIHFDWNDTAEMTVP